MDFLLVVPFTCQAQDLLSDVFIYIYIYIYIYALLNDKDILSI